MTRRRTIVFVGGGSGGHLFPALAVIEQLLSSVPAPRVVVLSSERRIDRQILEPAAARLPGLEWESVFPVPRGGWLQRQLTAPLKLLQGRRRGLRLLRALRPQLVVGLGAFASVPGVLAASQLQLPVVLLEWNTVPGTATRLLASRAVRIFHGLPLKSCSSVTWADKVEQTGVPIRSDFVTATGAGAAADADRFNDRRLLLILGGSQGASRLNQIVRGIFSERICGSRTGLSDGWTILHQTGEADLTAFQRFYAERGLPGEAVAFLHDLPAQLLRAGLVISRAGAVTLAEIAAAAVPSILLPLSSAAGNHQHWNADLFRQAGAGRVVCETDIDASGNAGSLISELCGSLDRRRQMSMAAKGLARSDAAKVLAERLAQLPE